LLLTPSPVEPLGATGGLGAGYSEQPERLEQTDYNPAEKTELDLRRRELMLREKEMRMRELEIQKDRELRQKEVELREKEL